MLGSPDVFALHWGDASIDETISKLSDRLKTIIKYSFHSDLRLYAMSLLG